MNLFQLHGKNLVKEAFIKVKNDSDDILHCGDKRTKSELELEESKHDSIKTHTFYYQPFYSSNIEYGPNYHHQYFCKDLWLISSCPPCYCCAMACVHSRISRLFYLNKNPILDNESNYDKAMNMFNLFHECSKYLNHSYDVFEVKICE